MDAAQAISLVVERIRTDGQDYPTEDLTADRILGGWCVYAPVMVADGDPVADVDEPVTRSVFLVGVSGRVEEVSSTEPAEDAREQFAEACLWFGAGEPRVPGEDVSTTPSHPDFSRFVLPRPPRPAAAYDNQALYALAEALVHERDFGGWLAGRLRELAGLVGGASRLVVRRPKAWAAGHVTELAAREHGDAGPSEVWRTWPPVDPAGLPAVDTAGWLLVPGDAVCEYLEALESETAAATRLADTIADRARQASPWRSCGVSELVPQLVAVRRDERFDADLATVGRLATEHDDEDFLGAFMAAGVPDDADVEALLRIAIDAEQRHLEVIDVDAPATAAYRRLLDRIGLAFETEWFEAMFEL
ncbi:hypothetical protein AB0K14_33105 [Actinosynnema sp. NPDC050801]|uniref:hypothetical protein n=1 Tax=unclassified Actinosynnema TaxID=2637065 RepID=UPI00341125D0